MWPGQTARVSPMPSTTSPISPRGPWRGPSRQRRSLREGEYAMLLREMPSITEWIDTQSFHENMVKVNK
eukprot:scaffold252200_cov35-Prasinocladus_malaysianus.AAC.1